MNFISSNIPNSTTSNWMFNSTDCTTSWFFFKKIFLKFYTSNVLKNTFGRFAVQFITSYTNFRCSWITKILSMLNGIEKTTLYRSGQLWAVPFKTTFARHPSTGNLFKTTFFLKKKAQAHLLFENRQLVYNQVELHRDESIPKSKSFFLKKKQLFINYTFLNPQEGTGQLNASIIPSLRTNDDQKHTFFHLFHPIWPIYNRRPVPQRHMV